jgi:putative copper resistance protein D
MPWIVWARWLQFCAVLGYAGLALFWLLRSARDDGSLSFPVWFRKPLLTVIGAGIAATPLWLWCQTAQMSGDGLLDVNRGDLVYVLAATRSGTLALTRMTLLVAALLLGLVNEWRRPGYRFSHALIGVALLGTLAGSGHGMMDLGVAGLVHLSGDMLHLLAAAIWFGALIALLSALGVATRTRSAADVTEAHRVLNGFSAIGIAVVAVLVLGGLINSWFLVGPYRVLQLYQSSYGRVLGIKLLLFAAMLVAATCNRFWLLPRLDRAVAAARDPASALAALRHSLRVETLLALLVLLAVGELQYLTPPVGGG